MHCLGIILCVLSMPAGAQPAPADTSADEEQLVRIQQSIQAGDLRRARSELQEALTRLPKEPRIYNLLGVIDAQEKHFTAAETNFRRAIQLAPRFTGAYLNLGRLYQENANQQGAVEKALDVYRKLLESEPDHVEANYQAAWLLNRLGKFGPSLDQLARLPAEAQQRAPALALRGVDNAALGRRAPAEAALKQLAAAGDLTEADVLPILPALHEHHADDLATRLLETLAQRGLASNMGLQALAGLAGKAGPVQGSSRISGERPATRASLRSCADPARKTRLPDRRSRRRTRVPGACPRPGTRKRRHSFLLRNGLHRTETAAGS